MKWRALNKTGRPNITQANLVKWEDWQRIVKVPKSLPDYNNVIKGRRAISPKFPERISTCFGIPEDFLEPKVPLTDLENYLDETIRGVDRHVPVEETRQLFEISRYLEKTRLAVSGKKHRLAKSLYAHLIENYSQSLYLPVLERLASAYLEYGDFLTMIGQTDSALDCYNRLINNYDSHWPFKSTKDRRPFLETVLRVMVEKGRLLRQMGFLAEAAAVLDDALSRFEDDVACLPSLRKHLDTAIEMLRGLGANSEPTGSAGKILNEDPAATTSHAGRLIEEPELSLDFLSLPAQKRLLEFRERFIKTHGAGLLLGPQISTRSGIPDESAIGEGLSKASGLPLTTLPRLCEAVINTHGSEWLHRHLAQLLDDETAPLSDIHQIAARIDFQAYLTTNADRLMEWALKDAVRAHRSIFFEPDKALLTDNEVPLVKFNGSVDHPHTLHPYFDPSRLNLKKFERVYELLGNVRGLLIVGYDPEMREFRDFLKWLQKGLRASEILMIVFGANKCGEGLKKDTAFPNCFVINPGNEKPYFLPHIMGRLGKMSTAKLNRLSHRRLFRANPFPGLHPYRYRAAHFYGRESIISTLLEKIDMLSVTTTFFGESGCGKTSLFQAALVPELEKQNNHLCVITQLKGVVEPEDQLAKDILAKARRFAGEPDLFVVIREIIQREKKLFLVLDQFEQFFYPPFSEEQRDRFLRTTLPALAAQFDTRSSSFLSRFLSCRFGGQVSK